MKLRWSVKYISDELIVGKEDKQTSKVTVCIEAIEEVERPDKIAIDFIWDKQSLLENLEEWDIATFHFGTSYNRWNEWAPEEKIFNSIKGWKVDEIVKNWKSSSKTPEDSDLPF